MFNKNKKNILMICISFLCFILIFLTYTSNGTIANLKLEVEGSDYKEPSSFTFLEGLSYSFLASGLTYNYGISPEIVNSGFQTILNTDFSKVTKAQPTSSPTSEEQVNTESTSTLDSSSEEILNSLKESLNEATNDNKEDITYSVEKFNTKDEKTNKEIDNKDITYRFTLPKGLNKDNFNSTSNIWQINYRFYNEGLTGLDKSYWSCQLFKEEQYFNRTWNSLKWMLNEELGDYVINSDKNSIESIFNSDNKYWYLTLTKTNKDFGYGKTNCFQMQVTPIDIDDATQILKDKGLINSDGTSN